MLVNVAHIDTTNEHVDLSSKENIALARPANYRTRLFFYYQHNNDRFISRHKNENRFAHCELTPANDTAVDGSLFSKMRNHFQVLHPCRTIRKLVGSPDVLSTKKSGSKNSFFTETRDSLISEFPSSDY